MIQMRPLFTVAAIALASAALAQDRLAGMIDISERTAKKSEIIVAMRLAHLPVRWIDQHTVSYKDGDVWITLNAETGLKMKHDVKPGVVTPRTQRSDHPNGKRRRPARGRQYTEEFSPDASTRAFYEDGNLYVENADGSDRKAVTTDGDLSKRIKFGSASWVYGEELGQRDAMGWSPDGTMLWYYRFDESMVKDYFIAMSQTKVQTTLDTEAYPKAGTDNPECELYIYHVDGGGSQLIDIREGEFGEGVGHYVYRITWSPDRTELLFHRTNRWQNVMEFCAADPETGAVFSGSEADEEVDFTTVEITIIVRQRRHCAATRHQIWRRAVRRDDAGVGTLATRDDCLRVAS